MGEKEWATEKERERERERERESYKYVRVLHTQREDVYMYMCMHLHVHVWACAGSYQRELTNVTYHLSWNFRVGFIFVYFRGWSGITKIKLAKFLHTWKFGIHKIYWHLHVLWFCRYDAAAVSSIILKLPTDICIHAKACLMTTPRWPSLQRSDCTTRYNTHTHGTILMVATNVYAASSFHYAYAH